MKISPSPTIFRSLLSVFLFVLCLPLLWAQGWGDENPPEVTWIDGLQAKAGTTITIHGDYLSAGPGQQGSRIWVKLGNGTLMQTTPDSRSNAPEDAKIEQVFEVPADATSGPITIHYNDLGGFSGTTIVHDNTDSDDTNDKDFNRDGNLDAHDHFVLASITGLEPERIAQGEMATIRGAGFPTNPRGVSVSAFFNASLMEACFYPPNPCEAQSSVSTDGTSVTFTVPDCATPGAGFIRVWPPHFSNMADASYPTCVDFEYNFQFAGADPEFTSFSPTSARVGEEITITGMNFAGVVAQNEVAFGNDSFSAARSVEDLGSGAFGLKIRVPANAATGKIKLKVSGGTPILSPTDFTRLSHTVTSFRPTNAVYGQVITIVGTNFAEGARNEVHFIDANNSSTSVQVNASSNGDGTEIYPIVPDNAPSSGSIEVSVGPVSHTLSGMYTVRALPSFSFTDFEPKSIRIGDTITLSGTGFHPTSNREYEDIWWGGAARAEHLGTNDELTESYIRAGENIIGRESEFTRIRVDRCISPPCRGTTARTPHDLPGLVVEETAVLSITSIEPASAHVGQEITIRGTGFSKYKGHHFVYFAEDGNRRLLSSIRSKNPTALAYPHEASEDGTWLKVRVPNGAVSNDKITVGFTTRNFNDTPPGRVLSATGFGVSGPAVTNPPPTEPPTNPPPTNPPPTEPPTPDPLRFYSDMSRMTPQATAYMADVTASATEDTDLQDIYVGGPGTLSLLLVENESASTAYAHPSFKLTATTSGQHYKLQVKDISSLTAGSAHTLHLYLSTNEANVDAVRTTVVVTIAVESSSVDFNFYRSSARMTAQTAYTGSVVSNAAADTEVANIYAGGPGMLTLLLVENASSTEAYDHSNFKLVDGTTSAHYQVKVKSGASLSAGTETLHLYLTTDAQNQPVRATVVITITAAVQPGGDTPSPPAEPPTTNPPTGGDEVFLRVGVVEHEVRLYPNPASYELRFTGLEARRAYVYKIYSLVGQVVREGGVRSDSVVDLSSVEVGQYVFVLRRADGREVLRTQLQVLR